MSVVAGPARQGRLGRVSGMQASRDVKPTRDIKLISSAGARALADAARVAEQNKQTVPWPSWIGGAISSNPTPWKVSRPNGIDTADAQGEICTALAAPHVGDQQDVRSGEKLAPTFMNTSRSPVRSDRPERPRSSAPWACRARRRECAAGCHGQGVQQAGDDDRQIVIAIDPAVRAG